MVDDKRDGMLSPNKCLGRPHEKGAGSVDVAVDVVQVVKGGVAALMLEGVQLSLNLSECSSAASLPYGV